MLPPLQLESYLFPVVKVVAQKEHLDNEGDEYPFDLKVKNAISGPDEDGGYHVGLSIDVTDAEGAVAPYAISLEVVGTFTVVSGFPEEEREKLLQINGCSMLFGMAREFLMSITARGPWGGFMLPTVSFYTPPEEEGEV